MQKHVNWLVVCLAGAILCLCIFAALMQRQVSEMRKELDGLRAEMRATDRVADAQVGATSAVDARLEKLIANSEDRWDAQHRFDGAVMRWQHVTERRLYGSGN